MGHRGDMGLRCSVGGLLRGAVASGSRPSVVWWIRDAVIPLQRFRFGEGHSEGYHPQPLIQSPLPAPNREVFGEEPVVRVFPESVELSRIGRDGVRGSVIFGFPSGGFLSSPLSVIHLRGIITPGGFGVNTGRGFFPDYFPERLQTLGIQGFRRSGQSGNSSEFSHRTPSEGGVVVDSRQGQGQERWGREEDEGRGERWSDSPARGG